MHSKKLKLIYSIIAVGIVILSISAVIYARFEYWPSKTNTDTEQTTNTLADLDEDGPIPSPVTTTPQEIAAQPRDTSALGGYNVLIADRGNNRLIEVTPDKKIIWEYQFDLPRPGLGADDSFFADGGKQVIVNLEMYHVIEIIDYATKKVVWSYGTAGKPGHTAGYLNTPDDAYKLPNGDITVADIKNCRVIEIAPDKHIVHQYGKTRQCTNQPGFLDEPNGDTPLPNDDTFISTIRDHNLLELNQQWQPIFSMPLPISYPSDPQATQSGNILVADYRNPGKIIEISHQGKIVWQFTGDATTTLNKPSLAIELPNGNILANDDFNHRIIVIDKTTKQIIWQYGVTGKPGVNPGQLNIPDGMDIIKIATSTNAASTTPLLPLYTVGQITRHANQFIGQEVRLQGYLLEQQKGYAIFSDESTGTIGRYDLPITGDTFASLQPNQRYEIQGIFLDSGLTALNNNPDHLSLTLPPIQL